MESLCLSPWRSCLLAAWYAAAAWAQPAFYLKDGDRVVFYGDSITDQRLYTTYLEAYVITRFPHMNISFVHSGVGGDRVNGGMNGSIDVRLARDVVAYKPTAITIMLGMNDGEYHPFDQKLFLTYTAGYRHIIQSLKESLPGVRITVVQPSPFDDVTRPPLFEGGYNQVLIRYGEFVKQLGREEQLQVADLNTPVVAALDAADKLDAELARKIIPDRVHPSPGGHLLMAEALLKAWHAPAIVTAVEIDAAGSQVVQAENTQVSNLAVGDHIFWMQTDAALPMPIDANDSVLMLAVRESDFVEALDQEPLKIRGLTADRYHLKIDDEPMGVFTREQLAAGVNLATLPTPMATQAARVHDITTRHVAVHFARWRLVEMNLQNVPVPPAHIRAAADALNVLDAEAIEQQHIAAQPKPHRFELSAEP